MKDYNRIAEVVNKALSEEIEKIIQEEAIEAGKRAEKRVREATVQMTANVLQRFEMQQFGPDRLEIRVRFDDVRKI